ncbi:hypothetical protein D7B24_000043 [Verticillium nonalfalfae]|uniref:Methyltransferase type 11 domain-containing protein n=1 Tax=Verticillium nonalfalfae TaxID=1051616 RepID=A0A3M9YQ27_9PEZI|nr:uncharacterized protein D7B24_000043 [Verticillium nonalfalfae]RNJ61190.1 hypothetical protein D7B24_000043 [Verticillium nonalfalfae]
MTQTLHPGAQSGFADASSYDAHRPSYPAATVTAFLEKLGLAGQRGARVLDLAAGTGKLTEVLAARDEGFEIVGVEPHAGMRGELARKGLAGVEVRDGFAEEIPLGDGWGDGCVVAQAFHWFANERALREMHRVLKPRSSLGLIWNIEDYNKPAAWTASTHWEQRLNELIHSLDGDGQARFRNDAWRACFDSQAANPLKTVAEYGLPGLATTDDGKAPWFAVPIGEASVPFTVWLTEEALWKRLSTLSQVAVLEGDDLSRFRARLAEMLKEESVERNDKGEVALHGKTFFAWTSRL